MLLKNKTINDYQFLVGMYSDGYFPDFLVDKIKIVLMDLCESIESQRPESAEALFTLSHAATESINDLEQEFDDNDSEIETVARDVIAEDFEFIVRSYGFVDVDIEDVIATREW